MSKSFIRSGRARQTAAVMTAMLALTIGGPLPQAASASPAAPAAQTAPGPVAAAGTVITTSDATFDRDVLQSKAPALVELCAEWSGPCKFIEQDQVLENTARDHAGRLTVAYLDIDQNPATLKKYNPKGIPAFYLFKNGQVVSYRIGPYSAGQIKEWLQSNGIS
ncbi:thioredoxin domain-containing protein [Streptomyces albulus]|nr:thioredoxin domain-containing protein [Streptomyces noursei]